MSGKRSRDKGQRFERFLVKALQVCYPDTYRGQQAHNPRHCDVEGTPFRLEAKHWKKLTYKNVLDAIAQAEENGARFNDPRIPMAITKLDGSPPIVHFTLRRFVQMVETMFYSPPDLADVIPIKQEDKT